MTANVYSRIFGPDNRHFSMKPEYNKNFLQTIQNWMNDKWLVNGFVFLNDVYDALGFSRTQAGAVSGWFKEPGSKPINFEIEEMDNGSLFISFDVDGVIYKKLPVE